MGMGFAASLSAALCRLQRAGAGRSRPLRRLLFPPCVPARRRTPRRQSFSLCLSAFPYGEAVRPLFDRLKSGDEGAADQLAALMIARWEARGLAVPDIAAFVPAKPGQYGQAEALARRIGPVLGAKVLDHFLTRHQNSRVQHTLPMEERLKNAAASYACAEGRFVSGRVLLVDDIVTTGATLSACAQLLLTAGAREVLCLTAAATPRLYI